jgi:hypothetical protein
MVTDKKLPKAIDDKVSEAMFWSVTSTLANDEFESEKADVFKDIKDEGIELIVGESIRTTNGLIRWQDKKNYSVNTDILERMVRDGEITVKTILSMVSTWRKPILEAIVPSAVNNLKSTEFGVFEASHEFKEDIRKDLMKRKEKK